MKLKFSYRLKKTLLRAAALFCAVSTAVAMTACSDKGETSAVQLSPKETVEKIFTLAKSKDYDSLAEYCRSFSKMSMELYFTDTGTDYDAKWLSRYSATLASIFDNYVTYDNLTEKADKETRTGSVTGTFTALDMEKFNEAKAKEHATMIRARQIALNLNLNMKIGDVEYQGDGNKAIFYYIADERVDFRQLIKVLAEAFRVRIEMKQIGARQEAGRIGGIGPCGRELCCATWMTSFVSVSTSAARFQDISLNPQKLAGQCAKLKCCLNYEVDCYVEAQKRLPSKEIELETKDGTFYFFKADILSNQVSYSTDKNFPANLVTISGKRAFEVIGMNKKGMKPDSLLEEERKAEPKKPIDLLEQESVTRFDRSRNNSKEGNNANRNKKKKKGTPNNRPQQQVEGTNRPQQPQRENEGRPQPAENGNRGDRENRPRNNNNNRNRGQNQGRNNENRRPERRQERPQNQERPQGQERERPARPEPRPERNPNQAKPQNNEKPSQE